MSGGSEGVGVDCKVSESGIGIVLRLLILYSNIEK